MPRFTVIKNPPGRNRKGGYALHDNSPGWIEGEDVEGVGWYQFSEPRRCSSVCCWFKYKHAAVAHAQMMNTHYPAESTHPYEQKALDRVKKAGVKARDEVILTFVRSRGPKNILQASLEDIREIANAF